MRLAPTFKAETEMRKTRECPKCRHPKSVVTSYDGDYWRICEWCGTSTRPCPSRSQATVAWNNRVLSPKADKKWPKDDGEVVE
jgi:transcription elongation factor Elf1